MKSKNKKEEPQKVQLAPQLAQRQTSTSVARPAQPKSQNRPQNQQNKKKI